MEKFRKQEMNFSDNRARLLAEYFAGIKLIKYFGWENLLIEKVMKVRNNETKYKLYQGVFKTMTEFTVNLIPILISVAVFGLYVATG